MDRSDKIVFSIIIPFKTWSKDLDECLSHIEQLSYHHFEIILLPDAETSLPGAYRHLSVQVVPTGPVNPAIKRDIGAENSKGEFLAFIDDDAYPETNWLDVAYRVFTSRTEVGAIGGPAVTPEDDPFGARVSGAVFLSRISGGFPERYLPKPPGRFVEDWPTVNLFVRKDLFNRIGGFDSEYWPGEDTLFCLKIVEKTGKAIFYVPDLVVWHHRRAELAKHLRQVGSYGLHRGYFAKVFPRTSRKIKYFIPSLWAVFVGMSMIDSLIPPGAGWLSQTGWMVYLIALAVTWVDILRYETKGVAASAIPYIMLTHIWYGIKFMQGLGTTNLKSSLGR